MFLTNSNKKNQPGGIMGLDLCDQYVQISVLPSGADQPETLGKVRRMDWQAETEGMEQTAVWTFLIRKAFGSPRVSAFLARTALFVVCMDRIDRKRQQFLEELAQKMRLDREEIIGISREESFFAYSVRQPEALWKHACMVCDFTGEYLRTLLLVPDRREKPIRTQTLVQEYPELIDYHETGAKQSDAEDAGLNGRLTEGQRRKMDQTFLNILSEAGRDRVIDTVYLIGEPFEDDWYEESLKVLCRDRRAFLGDNLYSKGACYAGRSKMDSEPAAGEKREQNHGKTADWNQEYQYISADCLEAEIGLLAFIGGKSVCQPLLKRGTKWYEAQAECEFYLNRDCSFSLSVARREEAENGKASPARSAYQRGRGEKEVVVTLDGVPSRPDKATRIHLKIECPRAGIIRLTMEDLGLGEMYPATHRIWEEEFRIGGETG